MRQATRCALFGLLLWFAPLTFGQESDPAAALRFRPDRLSAERIKQLFFVKVSQQNRQAAALLERALARKDVSALFEQMAAPYGLHDGNLADAITARDIMKRLRETGSGAPPSEQVLQQRRITALSLTAQGGPLFEVKRRELAEVAQLEFVVDYLAWSQRRGAESAGPDVPPLSSAPTASEAGGEQQPVSGRTQATGNFVLPVSAATQSSGNFTPMGSTFHVEVWYLYPGGVATNCSGHDPGTLQISLAALRAMRDCTGARWRRMGGKVQLQVSDRDPWNEALEQPAQPAGTRIQFLGETAGGAGTMPGSAGVAINTVDSGRLVLTADGRIRTVLSSATAIGGAGVGGGSSSARRLEGAYTIDGYVMTITAPNGVSLRRLVTVVHEGGKTYVYFQGHEYWPPR